MSSVTSLTICIYGTPRISVIKRLGYMNGNGKAIPREPWTGTTVCFGQKCLRVDIQPNEDKKTVNMRIESLVALGRFIDVKDVRVLSGDNKYRYPSLAVFLQDTGDGVWKTVKEGVS